MLRAAMTRIRVESHRLGFRKIQADSAAFMRGYLSRADTTAYLPLGRVYTAREIEEYIETRIHHWKRYEFGIYLLYLKSTDECIGYCGLEYAGDRQYVDLRYGLAVKHWGKGYAKEAACICLKYGFEVLHLQTIYGVAKPANLASIAVLLKIGMKKATDVNFYGDGSVYYRLRRSDWLRQVEQCSQGT